MWKTTLRLCKIRNTDLVQMLFHNCSCGECAKYQNRIFSISGQDSRFPKLPSIIKKLGGIHEGCRHNFYPVNYREGGTIDVFERKSYESLRRYEVDAIEYSNRPFVDEREPWEKARRERRKAEKKIEDKNFEEAISILENARKNLFPEVTTDTAAFELEKIIDEYKERLRKREEKERNQYEYNWLRIRLPDIAPKSFGGYTRMKSARTEKFLRLAEAARNKGIDISDETEKSKKPDNSTNKGVDANIRQLQKTAKLINQETDPALFFMYLEQFISILRYLVEAEKQNKSLFETSPEKNLNDLLKNKDSIIKDFLARLCDKIELDIQNIPQAQKMSALTQHSQKMSAYHDKLSDANFEYLEDFIMEMQDKIDGSTGSEKDWEDFYLLSDMFPELMPKSFNRYLHMKDEETDDYLKIVKMAKNHGVFIE